MISRREFEVFYYTNEMVVVPSPKVKACFHPSYCAKSKMHSYKKPLSSSILDVLCIN